ncbi:MAG: S8/S53 family peptidase [Planctomycetes bacterium]|nr:S8/S53 family peptidase [Planctomycetota bacterium]
MSRGTAALLILVGMPLAGSHDVQANPQVPAKHSITPAGKEAPREWTTIPKYDPNSDNPFQVDLRGRDVSKLDLRAALEDLLYAHFDDGTVWPAPERMPAGFDWRKIMELGKNPGLGVRRLHEEGITGRGVKIAIIDQRLLVDHQEYADRVRFYEEIDVPSHSGPQMHGAAVASIALGKTVGVAPGAELYYIARPGGSPLPRQARCIHRIIEVNAQLPPDNKIRVLSMSTGWGPSREGYEDIAKAVQKALAAGMLIVCTTVGQVHEGCDFDALDRSPLADPDVFESYAPGLFRARDFWSRPSPPLGMCFSVPMDSRTAASPGGIREYVFYRNGGYSWAVPYIAGVYALAAQVDPAITPEKFWALAVQTGRTIELKRRGMTRPLGPIVDPVRLIRAIQAGETATLNRPPSERRTVRSPLPINSETQTIVPGVRVGDYPFGMSKDELVKKLGEPRWVHWGPETYARDNLPKRYTMSYEDLAFGIDDDAIIGITVLSPAYRFAGGLGVGDPVEEIKQVFSNDFQLSKFATKDILTYEDQNLSFEISKNDGTVLEINVGPAQLDKTDSPRADRREGLEAYADVGGKDLRALDLRSAGDILDTLEFNQDTQWPPAERLPTGFDPQALLQEGMNPGLGVRALQAQGITGAGVHVGLIDQPLLLDHPEYAGKIVSYHDAGCGPHKSSGHGPAMASQLVGTRCGTAPGASLHVVAVPSWEADAGYYARALDGFVTYNEGTPKEQRIRVVSVSSQPSGEGSVYKNQSLWDEAVQRAQDQGILVLDCTWHHGFVSLCWLDPQNRESVEACTPGFRNGPVEVDQGHIHVPSAPRTVAQAEEGWRLGYAYDGGGRRSRQPRSKAGYSDTIPYAAGILALGWQIRPDLTPAQMKESLLASAHVHPSGAKIIHPAAFMEWIRKRSDSGYVYRFP